MTTSQVSGNNAAVSSAGVTTPTINVAGIVSSLMAVEQQPITRLNSQISSYQAKISALGSVQSVLSSFQSAVQGLNSLTFNSFSATSSNTGVVSATASSIAKPGTYSLTVGTLAQAQTLAATGQASATTAIGNGTATTLTFDFGTISGGTLSGGIYTGASFASNGSASKTVTIDSSNNTLSGIRDAINAANIGVTASIINDGSANPYRLVLTSNATGVANSMKISVAGDTTLGGLLSQDPAGTQNLAQKSAASNATFTVNGIDISKASNTVGDVVPGVTLNLSGTSASAVTLNVGPNTSAVSTAINGFVTAFNTAAKAIQSQTSYDKETKTAGTLQGDVSLSIIQSQMAAMLTTNIGTGAITNLTQIGIGFQKDGTLAVDSAKLNAALSTNYQAVAGLFVAAGSTTDNLVSYTSASSSTKAGTYALNITQLSTQGKAISSATDSSWIPVATNVNDALNLTIDGTSTSVTLPAGTYTAASLATQLQTLINGSAPISSAGKSVTVSQNAGILTIMSSSYGSTSSVSISGNGASNLFGTPTQTSGLDVAGTINGMAATGNGQLLTSILGDSNGLSVSVQGSTTGDRGVINYSQGLSSIFSSQIATMLGSSGSFASETRQLNTNISDINKQIDAINARIEVDRANLTSQYAKLDAMLGSMNQLSSYLTQQLARL